MYGWDLYLQLDDMPFCSWCVCVSCIMQLVDQKGFKDEHLCWGQVKDMTLFDKIVTLPRKDKKPGAMEG